MARKSATLTNVQQSMGEVGSTVLEPMPEVYTDVSFPLEEEGENKPPVQKEFYIFRLKKGSKNTVFIDGIEDVIDPKTGKTRRARLLTGVGTIWMDEQKDLDKDFVNRNRRSIRFDNRIAKIMAIDETALEFLRLHNGNVDNPKKVRYCRFQFEEHNPLKAAQEAEAKAMAEFEAMQKALTCDYNIAKKHAAFLGVRFTDEFGEAKLEKTVRYEYSQKAKANPEFFNKTFDSELVEVNYLVRRAVSQSKIMINGDKAYWGTGALICTIPPAANPTKHLIDFALTRTKEANDFLSQLKQYSVL